MNTALPFHNLEPKKYVSKRYSPLFITVVEDDVESLFQFCGLTFTDYFAAIAAQETQPIRVMNSSSVQQEPQDQFFNRVFNDTTMYSQSFIFPEYEEKDVTVPQLAPVPGRFPSSFHFPSPLSMRPPWYTTMIENLLQSLLFDDFNFCDLPTCIIYATMSGSNLPTKRIDEVRKSISFPNWMQEFVSDIPIVRIVVYDGLLVSKPPSDVNSPRGAFAQLFGLGFRSRRLNTPGGIDPVDLRNLFRYDEPLFSNPQFCGFLSNSDIDKCRQVIKSIYHVAISFIEQSLKTYQIQIENAKKINNRFKGLFSNKAPERVTQHLQIPWRKIIYLISASFQMLVGRYELARKNFLHFNSTIHDNNLPELRASTLFMSAMAAVMLPDGMRLFKETLDDVIQNIHQARSIRFLLKVPLIGIEFNNAEATASNQRENEAAFRSREAIRLCEVGIRKITSLWTGNVSMKSLFLAFFLERYAGLLRKERTSLFQTSRAALLYQKACQPAHSLRCYIWLFRSLPKDSWVLLYQRVWLEKAASFCQLSQWSRGLIACKDLLALPDLDRSLHERVISQFWAPFNDSSLDKSKLHIQINSLLEVRSLTMTDKTHPAYWGLPESEFGQMIKEFDAYVRQTISRATSVSFDSWYDEDDDNSFYNKSKAVRTVAVGTPLILTIELYNRYKFSVHLDRAILNAKYEGKARSEKTFEMEEIKGKDIMGYTRETTKLNFTFVPLAEGKFTVDSFTKNYWGYVDTVVQCDPLAFNAVNDMPTLKMEVLDFPEEGFASQCYEFFINVTNTGNTLVENFLIVYDHPNTIVSEFKDTQLGDVSFLTVHHQLKPSETQTIELILWIEKPGETVYHFCIASNGLRCGFERRPLKAMHTSKVNSVIIRKSNDSNNMIFQCEITSFIDNLSIVGLIDNESRFLKLIGLSEDEKPILNKGEKISIIGSTKDFDSQLGTAEAWRPKLMGKRPLSILYEIEGNPFYAQELLRLGTVENPYRIKVDVPSVVNLDNDKPSSIVSCKVSLLDPPANNSTVYVQPLPFKFVDALEDKHNNNNLAIQSSDSTGNLSDKNLAKSQSSSSLKVNNKVNSEKKAAFNGCFWFGMTRKLLSKENNYQAEFSFVAVKSGIYKIPALKVSTKPNFEDPLLIKYSQTLQIISE